MRKPRQSGLRPVDRTLIVLLLATLLSSVLGCSTKMKVSFKPEPQFPELYSEEGCTIRFFRSKEHFAERCEFAGALRIRDSGLSKDCSTDRIREEVRIAACRVGADRAVLFRMNSSMSTCIESDADLYVCPEYDVETEAELSPAGVHTPEAATAQDSEPSGASRSPSSLNRSE